MGATLYIDGTGNCTLWERHADSNGRRLGRREFAGDLDNAFFFPLPAEGEKKKNRRGIRTAPSLAAALSTGGFCFTPDPDLNDIGGAADARRNRQGHGRAIFGASAAFHAAVAVHDPGFTAAQCQYAMRTHAQTHAAACTFLDIKGQGNDFIQIT